MNKEPNITTVERTVEERRVEVNIDKKFEIDRDQLAFETNKEGQLQATYILTNNVQKEEKRIMYAIIEEDISPLIMEINGEKTKYHIFTVPKQGEVKVDFTLSGLPKGKHIVYIYSEKYIDNKTFDELEKVQSQKIFTQNYFLLDVQNNSNNNNNNLDKFDDSFKPVTKIEESYEGDMISLFLYEDQELSTEVSSIEEKKYYLLINNYLEFELKGHLYLFSDYNVEKLEQILVPANSKAVFPVNLENHKAKESIRFILLGEPTEKPDIPIPVRLMHNSMRIPIK
ncbi:hypothetical protein [Sporosarcina highlanderae]|uniref:Intracellular proteinase inhibitor BsuPI domain-containing protein n=1 Tax=Sporosarcina highlanderae TaxID=3035916 RepID=A0ABT8JM70_9BACL|nr:hypothetical protein [Sporosarcina highlanderae]MDN4606169.1 hypothetical protein [Sporosarcina highlanderae]